MGGKFPKNGCNCCYFSKRRRYPLLNFLEMPITAFIVVRNTGSFAFLSADPSLSCRKFIQFFDQGGFAFFPNLSMIKIYYNADLPVNPLRSPNNKSDTEAVPFASLQSLILLLDPTGLIVAHSARGMLD